MLRLLRNAIGRFPAVHYAIRSVWIPPERVFQHLYFYGCFTIEIAPGICFKMEAHGELIENDLFWRGYGKGWEGQSLSLWRDLAARSNYIVDVGSNAGVYALAAQAVNPAAKVLAVEPSQIAFGRLQENIALNGFPIVAENVAASDQTGPVTFYDFPGSHQYSASLIKGFRAGAMPVEVEAVNLDSLFEKHGFEVNLLKMDVEGHEPAALRGMKKTLEANRPTLIIEILNDEANQAVEKELEGLGYSAHPLGDGNVLFEP